MGEATLEKYLAAWSAHCDGKSDTENAMVAASHPDIRYSDINAPTDFVGHEGVRTICKTASAMLPGAVMSYRNLLLDGRRWSMQWTLSGTLPDGSSYSCEGASAGSVGEDGRVDRQTDYWNPAHIQSGV